MILSEIKADNIYIVCGYTDMRRSIGGLSAIVANELKKHPEERSLFLFCGKRTDRMKALIWESDGFLLLYKVLNGFQYQWPRNEKEVKLLTTAQYHRLLEGLTVERRRVSQPKHLL